MEILPLADTRTTIGPQAVPGHGDGGGQSNMSAPRTLPDCSPPLVPAMTPTPAPMAMSTAAVTERKLRTLPLYKDSGQGSSCGAGSN